MVGSEFGSEIYTYAGLDLFAKGGLFAFGFQRHQLIRDLCSDDACYSLRASRNSLRRVATSAHRFVLFRTNMVASGYRTQRVHQLSNVEVETAAGTSYENYGLAK